MPCYAHVARGPLAGDLLLALPITRLFRSQQYMWSRIDIMETVQIVLDKKLLHATDQAARRAKRNRSALVRDALREHLQRLEVQAREEDDRRGYAKQPQALHESRAWEAEAAWPAE